MYNYGDHNQTTDKLVMLKKDTNFVVVVGIGRRLSLYFHTHTLTQKIK